MTKPQPEPTCFIFVTSNLPTFDEEIPAPKIIKELLKSGYWLLGSRTRNRKRVKKGDRAVFYAAGSGNSTFVAAATIASKCTPISPHERRMIDEELVEELGFEHPGLLSFEVVDVSFFDTPVPARQLVDQLGFIKNRARWGGYFQGGSVSIPKEDFELILTSGRLREGNT